MALLTTVSGATTSCIGGAWCAGGHVPWLGSMLDDWYLRGSWHSWCDATVPYVCETSLVCLWCMWDALVVLDVVVGVCAGLVVFKLPPGVSL